MAVMIFPFVEFDAGAETLGDLEYRVMGGAAVEITRYLGEEETVVIPDTINELPVTSIGNYAFASCSSVTNIIIPDSMTNIGDWAFYHCESLTSVSLGRSISHIGNNAFYHCPSLISFDVDPENIIHASIDGILYNKDVTVLIQCPVGKIGDVIVPDSVTIIGDRAFSYCPYITSITLGDNVVQIGNSAFTSCTSLTSITIPDSVTTMGYSVFHGCYNLATITIGNGVTSISDWTFAYCSSLTSIVISEKVTSLGEYLFYDCSLLTSVTIPDGVPRIGERTFYYCDSLKSLTIPKSVTNIANHAFYSCRSLTSIIFEGDAPSANTYWAIGCDDLVVYYYEGSTGFITPTWKGKPCYPLKVPGEPTDLVATPGDGQVSLSWSAPGADGSELVEYYVVYMNGEEIANITGTNTTVTGLTNGEEYTFAVKAGNRLDIGPQSEGTTSPFNVRIISPVDDSYSNTRSNEIHWLTDPAGMTVEYSIDGVNWIDADGATSYTWSVPSDGAHTFHMRAVDRAGNMVERSVTFTVDTVAPTVVSRTPSGNDASTQTAIIVEFSKAMNKSSVSITVDGVSGTISWDGNIATFAPSSGLKENTEYTVVVNGKDIAGNDLEETTWTFRTANDGALLLIGIVAAVVAAGIVGVVMFMRKR